MGIDTGSSSDWRVWIIIPARFLLCPPLFGAMCYEAPSQVEKEMFPSIIVIS